MLISHLFVIHPMKSVFYRDVHVMIRFLFLLLSLSLLTSLLVSLHLDHKINVNQLSFEITTSLSIKNNSGRDLDSVNISYLLPINAKFNSAEADASVGNEDMILAMFPGVSLYSNEEVVLQDKIYLSMEMSSLKAQDFLGHSPSNSYSFERVVNEDQLNYQLMKQFFTENKLLFRTVSGILALPNLEQVPKCWIQFRVNENEGWTSFNRESVGVIPIYVMPANSEPSHQNCREIAVKSWGVDVTSFSYLINDFNK
jgi:hypothetical protein